jgi:hypothetical protein
LVADSIDIWNFDVDKSVIASLDLKNWWYFPFALHTDDDASDFMNKLFRSFDTLNPGTDKVSLVFYILKTGTD